MCNGIHLCVLQAALPIVQEGQVADAAMRALEAAVASAAERCEAVKEAINGDEEALAARLSAKVSTGRPLVLHSSVSVLLVPAVGLCAGGTSPILAL